MWAKGTARATLLTASFVAFGAGPALADVTNGDDSVLGGNQVHVPVSVPVDVSGNAVAVVGHALAGSTGGASVRDNGGQGGQRTSGRHSIGGGNQVDAPISAPVNACGNAVAVFGQAFAGCQGGAKVGNGGGSGGDQRTSGEHSVLGGNQIYAPISAPINVCGNTAAVLGDAVAGCKGGATVTNGGNPGYGYGRRRTSGTHSIGGGNQVNAPVRVPVNVCGNAAAVVGQAYGSCGGDECITPSRAAAPRTLSELPQLPVSPAALRTGALPVTMGALPALPQLPYRRPQAALEPVHLGDQRIAPLPADARPSLPGLPGLPVVRSLPAAGAVRPVHDGFHGPAVGGPPKQLPPVEQAAAESQPGLVGGGLVALALGGLLAASAAVVSVTRRLRRR
jgi:hypothetical protein